MTKLAEAAIERFKLLPDEERERWAEWLLEAFDDEEDWALPETAFDEMARQALAEHRAGLSEPLEDLLAEDDD